VRFPKTGWPMVYQQDSTAHISTRTVKRGDTSTSRRHLELAREGVLYCSPERAVAPLFLPLLPLLLPHSPPPASSVPQITIGTQALLTRPTKAPFASLYFITVLHQSAARCTPGTLHPNKETVQYSTVQYSRLAQNSYIYPKTPDRWLSGSLGLSSMSLSAMSLSALSLSATLSAFCIS